MIGWLKSFGTKGPLLVGFNIYTLYMFIERERGIIIWNKNEIWDNHQNREFIVLGGYYQFVIEWVSISQFIPERGPTLKQPDSCDNDTFPMMCYCWKRLCLVS